MTKTNKILLGSLATLAVAAPLAMTVSCGSKSEQASLESDIKKISNANWSSENKDDEISAKVKSIVDKFIKDKLSKNKNIPASAIDTAKSNIAIEVKPVKEEAKNTVTLTEGKQYSITVKTKEKKDQTKIYDFNGKEVAMPVVNLDIKTNKILKADDMKSAKAKTAIEKSINEMYSKIDLKMKMIDFRSLVYKNLTNKINDFYKTNFSELEVSNIIGTITFKNASAAMTAFDGEFKKYNSQKTLADAQTGDSKLTDLKKLKICFTIPSEKLIGEFKNDALITIEQQFFKKS